MPYQIEAQHIEIAPSARIADGVRIRAERIRIGADTVISEGTDILCDELSLGSGCHIGTRAKITCPRIAWDDGAKVGPEHNAELNDYYLMGRHSVIGKRAVLAGQGFKAGEFLWVRDDLLVGGGGNKGPNSYCEIDDNVIIVDNCFLNVSERVTIGHDTGISSNCILLTHASGQPVLMGYVSNFAPIHVGSFVNITLNVIVLPGVTIGDYTMIAAGAIVIRDIPAHCMAAGNPAVVKRENYPPPLTRDQQNELVLRIMREYAPTLPPKGVTLLEDRLDSEGWYEVEYQGQAWRYVFGQPPDAARDRTIALAFCPPPALSGQNVHFDLGRQEVSGAASPLMEDLRDYLRRRAIRFNTGEPFRSLPLANLVRLKSRV